MTNRTERRFIDLKAAQIRVVGDTGGRKIVGYPAKYNVFSPVYGRFRERIAPGFFDNAIANDDIRGLFNHDSNFVLGRTAAGTLRLESDSVGLAMEIDAPATQLIADLVLAPIDRGDVTGGSFSFVLPEEGGDEWATGPDGIMERTLLQAQSIYDVGPVTLPFYPDTDMAMRSLESFLKVAPLAAKEPAERALEEFRNRQRAMELTLI